MRHQLASKDSEDSDQEKNTVRMKLKILVEIR